jgi:hypothetical protein
MKTLQEQGAEQSTQQGRGGRASRAGLVLKDGQKSTECHTELPLESWRCQASGKTGLQTRGFKEADWTVRPCRKERGPFVLQNSGWLKSLRPSP